MKYEKMKRNTIRCNRITEKRNAGDLEKALDNVKFVRKRTQEALNRANQEFPRLARKAARVDDITARTDIRNSLFVFPRLAAKGLSEVDSALKQADAGNMTQCAKLLKDAEKTISLAENRVSWMLDFRYGPESDIGYAAFQISSMLQSFPWMLREAARKLSSL